MSASSGCPTPTGPASTAVRSPSCSKPPLRTLSPRPISPSITPSPRAASTARSSTAGRFPGKSWRAVEARMKELVKADLPFERKVVPLQDAINYFQSKGQDEKVQLLKFRSKGTLVLYKLGDRCDYHHGFMVPSTGYLALVRPRAHERRLRSALPPPPTPPTSCRRWPIPRSCSPPSASTTTGSCASASKASAPSTPPSRPSASAS